jgi:hypothetical protein
MNQRYLHQYYQNTALAAHKLQNHKKYLRRVFISIFPFLLLTFLCSLHDLYSAASIPLTNTFSINVPKELGQKVNKP